ncbi:BZ3500_MvSof-1268-A1-R1_Chr12-2g03884 [Microbotryum saponariae]|uniref:BZ3500_MvSof-1268-A1-R1_Chr12-2g03884 protein n=1 Tax=Microbotryum saponariae TaxID=289078 RepID=A0A2X0MR84_9BASI|nr:BZ3500_MvSof-1268-A1-R1_Chr12-2g03884 [Microbotryum saponariae]
MSSSNQGSNGPSTSALPSPSPDSPSASDMSSSGISLGLARIHRLLSCLHSPHLSTPIIHISGTNGKGSVSSYLSSVLTVAGLRVGRFNSPHLVDEWDCLTLPHNRTVPRKIYESTKAQVMHTNKLEQIGATPFEILTATAYSVFASTEPKLDLAVIEVGMGGATDATNVVPADKTLMSIITSIELDHQKFLGNTIAEIAEVKAGIIKKGTEIVLAQQRHQEVQDVVKRIAKQQEARLYIAGEALPHHATSNASTQNSSSPTSSLVSIPLAPISSHPPSLPPTRSTILPISIQANLPLPGSYQYQNSAVALLAVELLRTSSRPLSLVPALSNVSPLAYQKGIEATRWAGRLDWVNLPSEISRTKHPILIDGAHNPSSAEQLYQYLQTLTEDSAPTTLIIAISAPRPPTVLLEPLFRPRGSIRKVVCVGFSHPDGMPWIEPTPPEEIRKILLREPAFEHVQEVQVFGDVEQALKSLGEGDRVVVAGSLYLAADVYRLIRRGREGGVEAEADA